MSHRGLRPFRTVCAQIALHDYHHSTDSRPSRTVTAFQLLLCMNHPRSPKLIKTVNRQMDPMHMQYTVRITRYSGTAGGNARLTDWLAFLARSGRGPRPVVPCAGHWALCSLLQISPRDRTRRTSQVRLPSVTLLLPQTLEHFGQTLGGSRHWLMGSLSLSFTIATLRAVTKLSKPLSTSRPFSLFSGKASQGEARRRNTIWADATLCHRFEKNTRNNHRGHGEDLRRHGLVSVSSLDPVVYRAAPPPPSMVATTQKLSGFQKEIQIFYRSSWLSSFGSLWSAWLTGRCLEYTSCCCTMTRAL